MQVCLVVAIIIGILAGVCIAVTLAILAGGWLVNWMFPTISYEFASIRVHSRFKHKCVLRALHLT
ncbi:MAG: hypothetical protein DWI29_05415 [Planctomycetota bacterium]|nr:MAG: hypothetical protein DWI29_05415 [Planctomycetota bacterium]